LIDQLKRILLVKEITCGPQQHSTTLQVNANVVFCYLPVILAIQLKYSRCFIVEKQAKQQFWLTSVT